jgi:DNA-binding XRE family transcriptional regulator
MQYGIRRLRPCPGGTSKWPNREEKNICLGGGSGMDWKEHKKRLMKDPEFRKEYGALEPEHRLASTLIRLRLAKGLTQEELARLMNTKQESIARLESGNSLPSLTTVKKAAEALDADLEINLRPRRQRVASSAALESGR